VVKCRGDLHRDYAIVAQQFTTTSKHILTQCKTPLCTAKLYQKSQKPPLKVSLNANTLIVTLNTILGKSRARTQRQTHHHQANWPSESLAAFSTCVSNLPVSQISSTNTEVSTVRRSVQHARQLQSRAVTRNTQSTAAYSTALCTSTTSRVNNVRLHLVRNKVQHNIMLKSLPCQTRHPC
jgi:hypothetical protein